jgi:hypothetical protein
MVGLGRLIALYLNKLVWSCDIAHEPGKPKLTILQSFVCEQPLFLYPYLVL